MLIGVNSFSLVEGYLLGNIRAFSLRDLHRQHIIQYSIRNGRNLVELVAVKCTTPVMEYDV